METMCGGKVLIVFTYEKSGSLLARHCEGANNPDRLANGAPSRCPRRRRTHTRILGQNHPSPAQPRRRSKRQPCPVSGRPGPYGLVPTNQRLRSHTRRGGQEQTGNLALPQTKGIPGIYRQITNPQAAPNNTDLRQMAPHSVAPSRPLPANLANGLPKFPSWNEASSATTPSPRPAANGSLTNCRNPDP